MKKKRAKKIVKKSVKKPRPIPVIVAFNVGSSSVKIAVVRESSMREEFRVHADMADPTKATGKVYKKNQMVHSFRVNNVNTLTDVIHQMLLEAVEMHPTLLHDVVAVGHRFVHGGESHVKPAMLTKKLYEDLVHLENLAPLHNPFALAGMTAAVAFFPESPQYVVFDTGFFHSLEPKVYLYALPYEYYEHYGVRRFGFHGISHEYLLNEAAKKLKKKPDKLNLVTCHLGSGSSLTAIKQGKPLDTTMGFSPLEGLTMSTRSGDIDPMVILALMDDLKMSSGEVADLLNNDSGLKGISGFTGDLRDIMVTAGHKAEGGMKARAKTFHKRAKLAFDMYLYDIQRYLASYIGLLGKVDAMVFSGGAGATNPVLRRLIVQGVPVAKKIKMITIPTNEELHIANIWQKLKKDAA